MWNKNFAILIGFLVFISAGKFTCFGDEIDPQFPLGTIGCLFEGNEDLCEPGARCIDDLLFGTCAEIGIPENFAYSLNKHDLKKLIEEIVVLVTDKFKWTDGYTQCLLQNVIISLTIQEPFSKTICYNLIEEWEDPIHEEIADVLGNLYKRTVGLGDVSIPQFEGVPLLGNTEKRDEIVSLHKYFDKSKGIIHKRKFIDPAYDSNYLSYSPRDEDLVKVDPRYFPKYFANDPRQNSANFDSPKISLEDLEFLESYLDATPEQNRPNSPSKLSELLMRNNDLEQARLSEGPFSNYEDLETDYVFGNRLFGNGNGLQPGYLWRDEGDIYKASPLGLTDLDDNDQSLEFMDQPSSESDVFPVDPETISDQQNSLPPHLANTLDKLIRGEMEPVNMTDTELTFLAPYVTKMLMHLGDHEQEDGYDNHLDDLAQEGMETNMVQETENIPFGAEEEDMNLNSADDDDNAVDDDDNAVADNTNIDIGDIGGADINTEDMINNQVKAENQFMTKKSADGVVHVVKKEDVVDTNFAFVQMDVDQLSEEQAEAMITALEKIVSANPGSLENYEVKNNKLTINVDPILAGLNASTLAQQASDHKTDLEQATGLKYLKSGIGNRNEVEYKSVNDRYFILTFVLCGCIAGILLAVVVIYLIRRNTRSKEKLQQIASNQEGNEAASKDYQDLCRQRMQSKSSEKPEPLHAASRVGSVSESQVRSPSSRSSTSSWSEEPVNSNMDISTGHIVLSYMEDHLKNKDRLDQEWEAMCGYEADPSSTKVAQDTSNARKNRYGDVLPYDHSRVVMTSSTNVSGSDYINASTITDHDPRNPAYIATQGPLPHTVADFWQMVWEQGSVVIVMLTKLTENSEAKCHRYWPEEGSDLYHIYEVHLVSEHIWCDDYLVRSFYLKNLQTSETRTVTQFNFLTWPDLGIPGSVKALLDFRRKVNKSYRGRSCPIVVHCSDGCGRTGTYSLVDMVLNRMAKGAKEIDIAATLEHIRDQRMNMVKTKEQFQFALAAVAEEVHAILKALPQ